MRSGHDARSSALSAIRVMSKYDPVPDAIAFLARRTPIERHAIAQLLDTDAQSTQSPLQWS